MVDTKDARGTAPIMRTFNTGATRNNDDDKLDYEGFLSPRVLERYAQYLHKNRVQADGKLRDSDNWQKGIPTYAYMKSLWRHFMDVWKWHRLAVRDRPEMMEEALCAVIFNASGYLFELLTTKGPWTRPLSDTEYKNNVPTPRPCPPSYGFPDQQ